jgi:transcriptional regulator with XRE-family HTH domain
MGVAAMTIHARDLPVEERTRLLLTILRLQQTEQITIGDTIRVLRSGYLGMSQRQFAAIVHMSTPTLAKIETGAGNPTLDTLAALLRPFGLQIGVMPLQRMGLHHSGIELSDDDFADYAAKVRAAIAKNRRG